MLAPTSKIAMKTEERMYEKRKMTMSGTTNDWTLVHHPRKRYITEVVAILTRNLAKNMNTSAIPSTNPNLTEFLRMRTKEWRADVQKLSEEIAM